MTQQTPIIGWHVFNEPDTDECYYVAFGQDGKDVLSESDLYPSKDEAYQAMISALSQKYGPHVRLIHVPPEKAQP